MAAPQDVDIHEFIEELDSAVPDGEQLVAKLLTLLDKPSPPWSECVSVLTERFAVSADWASSQATAQRNLVTLIAANPTFGEWADPRLNASAWRQASPRNQWRLLSNFISRVVKTLREAVVSCVHHPAVPMGLKEALIRDDFCDDERDIDKVQYAMALIWSLMDLFMRYGVYGISEGVLSHLKVIDPRAGPGQNAPVVIIVEVLKDWRALIHALSITPFLKLVTKNLGAAVLMADCGYM